MINSICIFGDSVAKGVIFDAMKNKYSLLKESFVNIVGKKQQISISNYAKFGSTITIGRGILARHINELEKYDYTLLEFGGNDCDYDWAEISRNPYKKHLCRTPIRQFREEYLTLIGHVRQNGGKPALLNLPPIDSKRYFGWVSRGLNAGNILRFLVEIDTIFSWQGLYNSVVEEIARTEKIPMIDIRSAFLQTENYCDYLCEDGIHPNARGHLLISQTIEKKAFDF